MNNLIVIEPNHQVSDRLAKLEKLAETTKLVSNNRNSPNTLNGYASDWEDFQTWCDQHQFQSLPAAPHIVASYLADRAVNSWVGPSGRLKKPTTKLPLKLPTLLHRVWGIRFKHVENGYPFDSSCKEISEVLDGLRRSNTAKEVRKTPLLLDDIRKISEQLQPIIANKETKPNEARIAIRDRALLLLGFVSAMRRVEIAALSMQDIKFVEEGIEVHIMQSKTGERDLVIPYGSNPLTCPVRSLKAWLQEANITEGPIFRSVNRHGHISKTSLTGYSIALIIQSNPYVKLKIEESTKRGEDIPSFAGHSLRAGFVTTAIKEGVPEDLIMAQTGHKKRDTLDKYIRRTNKWKENAAIRIGL
jgi:integrase